MKRVIALVALVAALAACGGNIACTTIVNDRGEGLTSYAECYDSDGIEIELIETWEDEHPSNQP